MGQIGKNDNVRFRSRRVLIVEDDFILADGLRTEFEAIGVIVAAMLATLSNALHFLNGDERLDGAVLDIKLGDMEVYPLIPLLRRSRTPFVFVSGYDHASIPSEYANVRLCHKPIGASEIAKALFASPGAVGCRDD